MADISKVKLPSGTTYNLKDADARTRITALEEAVVSGITYIGTSTTEITDGGNQKPTIGGTAVTPVNGNLVFYGNKEFVFTGTWSSSASTGAWEEFGDMGSLGSLAFKNSATGSFTPSGSVSATFSGTSKSVSVSGTPSGTVSSSFSGTPTLITATPSATSTAITSKNASAITVSVSATANTSGAFQPAGTVSKPSITVTPTTGTVAEVATVGTLPTKASVSGKFTVANETLTIADFDYITGVGTLPTTNSATVMTGASAALASTPTFTGSKYNLSGSIAANGVTVSGNYDKVTGMAVSATTTIPSGSTANFTPEGTVSSSFTGSSTTSTGTYKPEGSVSGSFSGTAGTVTVS